MIYNPIDKFYKSITGAVPEKTKITFRVKGNFDSVVFVLRKDGTDNLIKIEMQKCHDYFYMETEFNVGLYFYYFDLYNGSYIINDNFKGRVSHEVKEFQLTVYQQDYSVPSWIYGGVIYQIFPDRFFRAEQEKFVPNGKVLHENWNDTPVFLPNEQGEITNNDFFGGDLKGIKEKLPYLKSLGVTVIYLNPIFKAFSNHRYDTGDYMQIDSLLGDKNSLQDLICSAKENGINIVLDGVFNHTGDDSIYFNKYGNYNSLGAYQSKESPYYKWYNFNDYPNKYESWWGIKTLPAINESNDDYVDFITGKEGVLRHYIRLGVSGWRLDVVDELPTPFVRKIREAIKNESSDAIIIGEVWEDASNKISYGNRREYLQGKELDSVMNYPLKNAIIDFVKNKNANHLSFVVKSQLDHYPHLSLHAMMNLLSTHDTMRLITAVGARDCNGMSKTQMAEYKIEFDKMDVAKFNLKVASLLQYTLCGVPSLYYGDEAGMQGYSDPLNRATYPWGREDNELIEWYKFLGGLRQNYSAFTCGELKEIYVSNGFYCYSRSDDNSEVLIAVNVGEKEYCFEFDGILLDLIKNECHKGEIYIKPYSMKVLICEA